MLNSLNLPKFSEANWRSTIRSELSRSTHFANIANWTGRETADIVYKDESGQLTQYLREHCKGDFPNQIREDRNFQTHPIEYFLEVKTTTGDCKTRFYMSSGQYKRVCDVSNKNQTALDEQLLTLASRWRTWRLEFLSGILAKYMSS